jgi:hypothetical protein
MKAKKAPIFILDFKVGLDKLVIGLGSEGKILTVVVG